MICCSISSRVDLIESWATDNFELTVRAITGIAVISARPVRIITAEAPLTNHLVIESSSIRLSSRIAS